MSRKYETLLLLSPELATDVYQEMIDHFTSIIEGKKGRDVVVDDWGIKNLAYPVKKNDRGRYVRLEYVMPGEGVAELERNIRIADGVFKFVTVKLSDKAEEVEA